MIECLCFLFNTCLKEKFVCRGAERHVYTRQDVDGLIKLPLPAQRLKKDIVRRRGPILGITLMMVGDAIGMMRRVIIEGRQERFDPCGLVAVVNPEGLSSSLVSKIGVIRVCFLLSVVPPLRRVSEEVLPELLLLLSVPLLPLWLYD